LLARAIGCVAVWSIIGWWSDSRLLLSDDGMHSNRRVADVVDYPWRWSIFDVFDSPIGVRTVLVAGIIAGLMTAISRRIVVRIGASIIVFLVLASLTARAPFAVSSAEMYLPALVFWLILIDLSRNHRWAVAATRLQVALVYAVPLVIRLTQGGDSWLDGSAIRRVVDNRVSAMGIAVSLVRSMPDVVLSVGTWAVLIVEALLAVVLVVVALAPGRASFEFRRTVFVIGVVLHLLIALVCGLWLFSAVAIAGLGVLLVSDGERRRSAVALFAPIVMFAVLVWNIQTISSTPALTAGQRHNPVSFVVRGVGLTQMWSVFSPNPPRATTWVEIRRDDEVIADSREANDRIRKLAQNVAAGSSTTLANAWLASMCERGNYVLAVMRLIDGESSPQRVERSRRAC
jgi:hypothetical protein